MEDNKAFNKAELQILDLLQSHIEGNRYGGITGIFETVPKLYELTADVAVKFSEYDFAQYWAMEHETENYNDEYYQLTKQSERFSYFITNIYQPR